MTELVSGLAFGALGSGHCALMCGPLAMLSPRGASVVGYHAGRMATYLVLGLVAGALGATASTAGGGRILAVLAGAWLLLSATGRLVSAPHGSAATRAVTAALARISRVAGDRRGSSFVFGALNGLLPCGLVYAAVIGATGFGSLGAGLWFLGGFGAGTIPALALAGITRRAITKLPFNAHRGASLALGVVGMLLIVRGVMPSHLHVGEPAAAPEHAHVAALTREPAK